MNSKTLSESSKCPICSSANAKLRMTPVGSDPYLNLIGKEVPSEERQWVICASCGHTHNQLRLTEGDLIALYSKFRDELFRSETPDQYFDRISRLPRGQSENLAKLDLLSRELSGVLPTGGHAVDIGCGGGVLIHAAQKMLGADWIFYGVEPTKKFADLAARRTGALIRSSNYEAGMFKGTKFDLAFCCQVLEHVPDPRNFLCEVVSDLKMGGLFYLEVPDISDFDHLPGNHDRFMVQHISYFSYDILSRLLVDSGFSVVSSGVISTIRGRNNLWFIARRGE